MYKAASALGNPSFSGSYSGSLEAQGENAASSFYDRTYNPEQEVRTVLKKQKYDPVLSVFFFLFGYSLMFIGDTTYQSVRAWWKDSKKSAGSKQ
jgi:hypothetical protein